MSQTVSQFGDKLDYLALLAVIALFPVSRTPFLRTQLSFFITLPVIALGPIAGILIDRWNKRRVMVVCDLLRAVCAALIPIAFILARNIYPVFILVFAMFLLGLFFGTARSAIVPDLVTRDHVLAANSLLTLIGRAATFLGMVCGGVIIDWVFWKTYLHVEGWTVAFVIDSFSFLMSAILLASMMPRLAARPAVPEKPAAPSLLRMFTRGLRTMGHELKEAVRAIAKDRKLMFAIAAFFLLVLVASLAWTLGISIIQQERGWGTRGLSILAAVGAAGLLVGAYLIGTFGHRFDLRSVMLVCFIMIGAGLVILPFCDRFWMFGLISLASGTAISPIFIGSDTLIHRHADEFIRGRIFSLREWVFNATFVAGCLIITSLKVLVNQVFLFVAFGAAVILTAISGLIIHDKSPAISPHHA